MQWIIKIKHFLSKWKSCTVMGFGLFKDRISSIRLPPDVRLWGYNYAITVVLTHFYRQVGITGILMYQLTVIILNQFQPRAEPMLSFANSSLLLQACPKVWPPSSRRCPSVEQARKRQSPVAPVKDSAQSVPLQR